MGSSDMLGVLRKLVSIIRHFHDGMKVRVRLGDGGCLNWFSVDQGLRQGCVLVRFLIIIYFAGVMSVVCKELDADDTVRGDFMRINQRKANSEAIVTMWTILRALC